MKQSVGHRIFLHSPAYAWGERARTILRGQANSNSREDCGAKAARQSPTCSPFWAASIFAEKLPT